MPVLTLQGASPEEAARWGCTEWLVFERDEDPQRLLDRVDLGSALKSELAFRSDLLPRQVSDRR